MPEEPKGVPVPPYERVRLHDREERTPLDEPGEHDECQTRRIARATRLRLAFEVQRQLLAKEKVLSGQLRVRAQTEPSEAQNVDHETEDRANDHSCR